MKSCTLAFCVTTLLALSACAEYPPGTVLNIAKIHQPKHTGTTITVTVDKKFSNAEGPAARQRTYSYRIENDKILLYILSFPAPNLHVFGEESLLVEVSPVERKTYWLIDGSNGHALGQISPSSS